MPPSPWDRLWTLFGRQPDDGLLVDEHDGRLVAITEQAVVTVIQRHAGRAERPLSYEAVVAVQLLAREGARVVVQLDRQAAWSLAIMVPTVRSQVADQALRASGLVRVLGDVGVAGYEEWGWW